MLNSRYHRQAPVHQYILSFPGLEPSIAAMYITDCLSHKANAITLLYNRLLTPISVNLFLYQEETHRN
jgi:hypothetical protein